MQSVLVVVVVVVVVVVTLLSFISTLALQSGLIAERGSPANSRLVPTQFQKQTVAAQPLPWSPALCLPGLASRPQKTTWVYGVMSVGFLSMDVGSGSGMSGGPIINIESVELHREGNFAKLLQ